jgi:magnesium chelatase subunit D
VSEQWFDALLAAACMATAPQAIKGIQIRAPAGPLRDYWVSYYERITTSPVRKIPCSIDEERLLGGIDIAASLTLGKPVKQLGLLQTTTGQTLMLAMAERLSKNSANLIAQAMDTEDIAIIALDESMNEDEALAQCLDDRLPVILTLGNMTLLDFEAIQLPEVSTVSSPSEVAADNELPLDAILQAKATYRSVTCNQNYLTALCSASMSLGLDSLRVPIAALTVAKIHAALHAKDEIDEEDVRFAVRIVMSPRALTMPEQTADSEEKAQPPEQALDQTPEDEPPTEPDNIEQSEGNRSDQDNEEQNSDPSPEQIAELQELVLQAAIASIPKDLLASLQNGQRTINANKARHAGNSGATQKGGKRGRPAGVFRKKPDPQARIHLLHTLRASIPWQKIRQEQTLISASNQQKILIRKDDFRYQKIEQKAKSTIVFAIDASGSSALHRLAEAKGAIELLLAQCYVRRDQVAVIAFRGEGASIILPPTRSLARAKRSLAGLPGGGGTPLASALDCTTLLSKSIQKKGETPFVVLLTDGRANISRSGVGGRVQAQEDANNAAREFNACGVAAIVLDTSPQPHYLAKDLADDMGAVYMPLPFAGAQAISEVVQKSYRQAT